MGGNYSYTLNNANATVAGLAAGVTLTETVTYVMTDADGDQDTATLTITITGTNDAPTLVVGSNESDDNEVSDPAHTVSGSSPLDNNGPVDGLGGNDMLIGDPGGTTLTVGDVANICLVLDTTNSLSAAQMDAMQDAVVALLNSLANSQATSVRVSLFAFGGGYTDLGTFDIRTEMLRMQATSRPPSIKQMAGPATSRSAPTRATEPGTKTACRPRSTGSRLVRPYQAVRWPAALSTRCSSSRTASPRTI